MSQKYLIPALESSLSKHRRLLLIALAEAADESGVAIIALPTLKLLTGLSGPQLRYLLRNLEQAGLLSVLERGYGRNVWRFALCLEGGAA